MGLSLVQSRALVGLEAPAVTVEVHLANGLPSFTLVGLAEVEVKEARERVRSALQNSGLAFPHNQRITVNLAPADLPKDSGRFDLPIALGILAASGQIDGSRLAGWEFGGELSLSGELRDVRGALAVGAALRRTGVEARLLLPPGSAQEAALVPDLSVYRARHLLDVVAQFLPPGTPAPEATEGFARVAPPARPPEPTYPDLADVKGQAGPRRALEIAAAGGHSLLMVGPPGTGKSMLAQRFAGLLPPLELPEALQSAAVASLAGRFRLDQWGQRPTRAPHHSASAVALVGGGSPPRPGEISLAHEGVLFLDELPEFPKAALEALREPLESGHITISRAAQRAEFPARFQLVAAMNPCPCGYLGSRVRACRCTPDQVARYQGKLSGPLLDRIDLHVEVGQLAPAELLAAPPGEATAAIRARCRVARERALARQGQPNQALAGRTLEQHAPLDPAAAKFLQAAADRLGWSARATHRAIKVARTVADLADSNTIKVPHLAEAVRYRRGLAGGAETHDARPAGCAHQRHIREWRRFKLAPVAARKSQRQPGQAGPGACCACGWCLSAGSAGSPRMARHRVARTPAMRCWPSHQADWRAASPWRVGGSRYKPKFGASARSTSSGATPLRSAMSSAWSGAILPTLK